MFCSYLIRRKLKKKLQALRCNYPMVADLVVRNFSGAVIPDKLAALLDAYTRQPCIETALQIVEFDPQFMSFFELARQGGFTERF